MTEYQEKVKLENEERRLEEAKRLEGLELLYKKSYYKNIDSIRKNIQFFFWISIIPMCCWLALFLFNLIPL